MSDLRYDPVDGRWVTIATGRNDRPIEFIPNDDIVQRKMCPFCEGNETQTPEPLAVYRADGIADEGPLDGGQLSSGDWLSRVFPNKYPSFTRQPQCVDRHDVSMYDTVVETTGGAFPVGLSNNAQTHGPWRRASWQGVQDLIVPTPRHVDSLSELNGLECKVAFAAFQDRLNSLKQDPRLQHAVLFVNCRSAAGASLEHLHAQLMGLPLVGDYVRNRVCRNDQHEEATGTNLIHTIAAWEVEQQQRVIESTDNFQLFCPFASRFAYQMWIVPNPGVPPLGHLPPDIRDELSMLTRRMVQRLESVNHRPPYNVIFHLPTFAARRQDNWYVEVTPRLATGAGLELATDIWVNPVSPENAAEHLSAVELGASMEEASAEPVIDTSLSATSIRS